LILSAVILTLVLSGILFLFINNHSSSYDSWSQPSKKYPQIYIRSNGNIETNGANSSAIPISRSGNVYTLTAAMELEKMTIERSNIMLDGNNFPIQIVGPGGYKHGPTIAYLNVIGAENVTLRNLNIPRFQVLFQNSLYCQTLNSTFVSVIMNNSRAISVSENNIWYGATVGLTNSSDCTVSNNAIAYFSLKNAYNNKLLNNNMSMVKQLAIRIDDSSSNLFFGNRIERSIKLLELTGASGNNFFVGNYVQGTFNYDPTIQNTGINTFYHNNFVYVYWNKTLASSPNNWDGNYWNDNPGNSPHIIDTNNKDNHPLMNPIDLKSEPQPTIP
jgi:parallel beta-helix repeat protein